MDGREAGTLGERRRAAAKRPAISSSVRSSRKRMRTMWRIMLAALMRSAAFSAIMMVAALVLDETTCGMIEASTTRSPSIPLKRRRVHDRARVRCPCGRCRRGGGRSWRAAGVVEVVLVGLHIRPRQAFGQDKGFSASCRMISRASFSPSDRHLAVVAGLPSSSGRSAGRPAGRRWPGARCRATAGAGRPS